MPWTVYNSDGQILQGSSTLADDAVTTAKILNANVTLAKMAANSIDSDQYVDASIDNAHLADDAVGVAELSATGTASSSTFLRGDNAWAATGGISNVVEDTTPQLGANLDMNDFGLAFPATQSANAGANVLDDYEEGTFTPGISDNSLDAEGDDKSQAYLTAGRVGRYVKIGRTVFIHGWVDLLSHSMQTSDRANLVGLPFTSMNTETNYRASIVCGEGGDMAITATATASGRIIANVAYCQMYIWDSTLGISALTVAKLGSSGNFSFTGHYEI